MRMLLFMRKVVFLGQRHFLHKNLTLSVLQAGGRQGGWAWQTPCVLVGGPVLLATAGQWTFQWTFQEIQNYPFLKCLTIVPPFIVSCANHWGANPTTIEDSWGMAVTASLCTAAAVSKNKAHLLMIWSVLLFTVPELRAQLILSVLYYYSPHLNRDKYK